MYNSLAEQSEAVTILVYEFIMALGGNLTDVARIRADRFRNKFNRTPVKFEF